MHQFANLYNLLDQTNKTNAKVDLLCNYFEKANEADKIWALALLCGRRPKRTVNSNFLRTWAAEESQIPYWLFEESYHTVGDLAETIALLIHQTEESEEKSLTDWMVWLQNLQGVDENEKRDAIVGVWKSMETTQRFVFNKLITGGFRIGVSQKLIEKALARVLKIPATTVAHRLMGKWEASKTSFQDLLLSNNLSEDLSKPYPFCLAHPLQDELPNIGEPNQWSAEWKWDGIRGQIIKRNGEIFIWSRGEDLITEQFPELKEMALLWPFDGVLDGEIVVFSHGEVKPFSELQTRIGRKNVTKKMLLQSPAAFIAYDVLEHQTVDLRSEAFEKRREILENLAQSIPSPQFLISESIVFESWLELAEIRQAARENKSEGLMLKKKTSEYAVGRKRGDWWKWKLDPYTIDAVMIYAMKGHGRRANLYTDYTFAVWNEQGELVPFTKAYSGLTDKEIQEVDAFVKQNTIERFGPVRSVKAELVFEIGFEGINLSARHKSGIALRFPRMLRWRKDKKAIEADHLSTLKKLIL